MVLDWAFEMVFLYSATRKFMKIPPRKGNSLCIKTQEHTRKTNNIDISTSSATSADFFQPLIHVPNILQSSKVLLLTYRDRSNSFCFKGSLGSLHTGGNTWLCRFYMAYRKAYIAYVKGMGLLGSLLPQQNDDNNQREWRLLIDSPVECDPGVST